MKEAAWRKQNMSQLSSLDQRQQQQWTFPFISKSTLDTSNYLITLFFDIFLPCSTIWEYKSWDDDIDWRARRCQIVKQGESTKTWNSNLESQSTCFRLYGTSFSDDVMSTWDKSRLFEVIWLLWHRVEGAFNLLLKDENVFIYRLVSHDNDITFLLN